MNWIPITTKTRTAPEFIGSDPVHRATWLCLMLYCAEHETGGSIPDCASWGDRRWMQTVGVTKVEIHLETPLYSFAGTDLVVWGYDSKYEDIIRAKREGGRIGGKLSGEARQKASSKEPAKESLKDSLNGLDRIGSDRIGRRGTHEGEVSTVSGMKADVPTLDQVKDHAAVVGLPEADAVEFYGYWTTAEWRDKDGMPIRNWKAKLASRKTMIIERQAKEIARGQNPARRRVADTHFQNPGRPYDGKF